MFFSYFRKTGVGKVPENHKAPGSMGQKGPRRHEILKYLLDPFGLYFVILREGSILRDMGITPLVIKKEPPLFFNYLMTVESRGRRGVWISSGYRRYFLNTYCRRSHTCASILYNILFTAFLYVICKQSFPNSFRNKRPLKSNAKESNVLPCLL
jgi:hypothetical protein